MLHPRLSSIAIRFHLRGPVCAWLHRLTRAAAGVLSISAVVASANVDGRPSDAALARMFAVPGMSADPYKVDWRALPVLKGQRSLVFRGVENESAFSHHPFIVFWDNQFFAQWNDGYVGEDYAGQRVRYAASADAIAWGPAFDLTGRESDRRFTACGFWIREGTMYGLAALRDATGGPETGREPVLLAYRWDTQSKRFVDRQVIARDFFAGNIPERTPDGAWLILGKSGGGSWVPMQTAKGGVKSMDDWTIRDLPGAGNLEEPEWYTLPNGHLVAHFRTQGPRPRTKPLYLARCYSTDSGETWSEPVVTNFPEKGARHHGVRLSNGLYALLVNPSPVERIPFSIALSKDGLVYDRIANVRAEATSPRWAGRAKSNGYHYMRGYEHDGKIYTIYSINKEDIEVTIVPLSELTALYP
jgi:hypothetical protein